MDRAPKPKQILYYAPEASQFQAFRGDLAEADCVLTQAGERLSTVCDGLTAHWLPVHSHEEALALLKSEYVHLVLLDLRGRGHDIEERGLALLDALDDAEDIEARYGFHRIVGLVGDNEAQATDQLLVELGFRGVRTALRIASSESVPAFTGRVLRTVSSLVKKRHRGELALCAAGGGITGWRGTIDNLRVGQTGNAFRTEDGTESEPSWRPLKSGCIAPRLQAVQSLGRGVLGHGVP